MPVLWACRGPAADTSTNLNTREAGRPESQRERHGISLKEIYDAALEYEDDDVEELVKAELSAGTGPQTILEEGLVAPYCCHFSHQRGPYQSLNASIIAI